MIVDLNRMDCTFGELLNFDFSPIKYYIYTSKFAGFFKPILPEKIMDRIFTKLEIVSDYSMFKDDYRIIVDEMGYLDVYYYKNSKNFELLYTGRRNIKLSDVLNTITEHKRNSNLDKILI